MKYCYEKTIQVVRLSLSHTTYCIPINKREQPRLSSGCPWDVLVFRAITHLGNLKKGKSIRILHIEKSFAVRERQRGCSRRAAQSFAKSSAVVRERQIEATSPKGKKDLRTYLFGPKSEMIRTDRKSGQQRQQGQPWLPLLVFELSISYDKQGQPDNLSEQSLL